MMKSIPNLTKEGLLASKAHLGTFNIVVAAVLLQLILDFLRTLATLGHVVVQDIKCLARVGKSLETRGEEAA